MKKIVIMLFMILIAHSDDAEACAGKKLSIGALNLSPDRVLAETVSLTINERTGTTVTVKLFGSMKELYAAVQNNEIGILIENTDHATELVGIPRDESGEKAYVVLKEEFRKKYNLVWLQPAGFTRAEKSNSHTLYSAVITVEVMNNFPALPRVINKLAGIMNDDAYKKMARSVESGEQPKKAARDFLKSKKII